MAKLSPYLFSNDAREQADFYVTALGGDIISIKTYDELPDSAPELKGRVMHLEFQAAGVHFYMADSSKTVEHGTSIDLTLEFNTKEDAEMAFNGLADNGRILMPFEKMFWGSSFGRLEDRYGVRWQISANTNEEQENQQ